MTAPDRMTLPMPIRVPSPIVQPWTTALWPTDTFRPITTGAPGSTWTETLSWRLLPSPSVMVSPSARSTALYQTLASSREGHGADDAGARGDEGRSARSRRGVVESEDGGMVGDGHASDHIAAESARVSWPAPARRRQRLPQSLGVPGRERVGEGHRHVILIAVDVRPSHDR